MEKKTYICMKSPFCPRKTPIKTLKMHNFRMKSKICKWSVARLQKLVFLKDGLTCI